MYTRVDTCDLCRHITEQYDERPHPELLSLVVELLLLPLQVTVATCVYSTRVCTRVCCSGSFYVDNVVQSESGDSPVATPGATPAGPGNRELPRSFVAADN